MNPSIISALFALLLPLALAAPQPQPRSILKRSLPRLGGVNLATQGCDFGMQTDGSSGTPDCPSTSSIAGYVSDGANAFRLPVGWQYLIGSTSSASNPSLSPSFFPTYDALVTAVTGAGAYALIDIHNYARFNGQIVGQGGPTAEDFADLWALLAAQYKDNDLVMFVLTCFGHALPTCNLYAIATLPALAKGLMNEPWGVDINTWATACQTAVTAIRSAGATKQIIVIPGNDWTHAPDWSDNANSPMLGITDPATGDDSLLILDVHQYLDSDGSGQSSICTTNALDKLQPLGTWLTAQNRKAIVSEIGAGNNATCIQDLGAALGYIADTSNAFAGFTVWSGGEFPWNYNLSLINVDGSNNDLFVSAVLPYLPSGSGAVVATNSVVATGTGAATGAISATSLTTISEVSVVQSWTAQASATASPSGYVWTTIPIQPSA